MSVYRTHSVLSRPIFTEGVIELAGGKASALDPSVTVLTSLLLDLANSSYPTSLRTLMLNSHSSWVTTFTDRPVSFYLAADPTLKSNLLFSGDAWINASRSVTPSLHVNAFLLGGMAVQPMFSSALNIQTEGQKLIQQFSTAMPAPVCQPIWAMVQAQFVTGNHVANATQLYNRLNMNPQMKPAVINQMINALITNNGQQMPQSRNFYNAVVADNTLWLSVPLRGQNGVWTNTIKSLVNNFGNTIAIASFFDTWNGSTAALNACTSPEYQLTAVYEDDPNTAIIAMSTEAGNSEIAHIIGTMGDVTMFEFAGKATAFGLDEPAVHDELIKSTTGDTMRLAEHHIYGSIRLGVQRYDTLALANILRPITGTEQRPLKVRTPWYSYSYGSVIDSDERTPYTGTTINNYTGHLNLARKLGKREYQLTDQHSNVLATVLDRKTGSGTLAGSSGTQYDHWSADIAQASDYYPGGMMMPGRTTEFSWSRMGYNSQEKDDEVYGKGNLNSALFWEMDTRILKRWNVDPKPNSTTSSYAVFNNNPILFNDPLGDTTSFYGSKATKPFLVLNDGSPNAVTIIDEKSESSVMTLANLYTMMQIDKSSDVEKVKAISTGLQQFGVTYDLQSFSDFEANNKGALADHVRGVSLQGASEFKLDGKPFTPRGEVIGNLIMKNGQVKAGLADVSSTNLTGSNSSDLDRPANRQSGQINAKIHTHPGGSGLGILDFKQGLHFDRAYLLPGVSSADRSGHPVGESLRSVIVEGDKIHLHNNNRDETITVDKPKPTKK